MSREETIRAMKGAYDADPADESPDKGMAAAYDVARRAALEEAAVLCDACRSLLLFDRASERIAGILLSAVAKTLRALAVAPEAAPGEKESP